MREMRLERERHEREREMWKREGCGREREMRHDVT